LRTENGEQERGMNVPSPDNLILILATCSLAHRLHDLQHAKRLTPPEVVRLKVAVVVRHRRYRRRARAEVSPHQHRRRERVGRRGDGGWCRERTAVGAREGRGGGGTGDGGLRGEDATGGDAVEGEDVALGEVDDVEVISDAGSVTEERKAKQARQQRRLACFGSSPSPIFQLVSLAGPSALQPLETSPPARHRLLLSILVPFSRSPPSHFPFPPSLPLASPSQPLPMNSSKSTQRTKNTPTHTVG
jgi:hypothetical protein